jgi:hypothetical protein
VGIANAGIGQEDVFALDERDKDQDEEKLK